MDFVKIGKTPPRSKALLSSPEMLVERLKPLIGTTFTLTRKARTDGSKFRKLVTTCLLSQHAPMPADIRAYKIVPPKAKGVPNLRAEYIDTYIVTSGDAYNLQVWNRNPNSESVQIEYANGETLSANDVRFVLGKVNVETNILESIIVMSPDYIENTFGKFGKPTIKQQLIISGTKRAEIIADKWLFVNDYEESLFLLDENMTLARSIKQLPSRVLPLSVIRERLGDDFIGTQLDTSLSTKEKGQLLERIVARKLGYSISEAEMLEGGYPDIPNQMLEVKVQESPTIDLGKYSPQFEETIHGDFTTKNMRYLIALVNSSTGIVEGVILCPGEELGKHFSYVAEESYKCQRSIPMSIFDEHRNEVVYNP